MSFHSQLSSKLSTPEAAAHRIGGLQMLGKKVVFTNGCFDILHPGHVDYLCRARDLADFLVLGLNTDASVRLLEKAPGRPVNTQDHRAHVLAALGCVDTIVLFDELTPEKLIDTLKPDILVKGSDYLPEQIAGGTGVLARGGKVITIPLLPGHSTTGLISRIKQLS